MDYPYTNEAALQELQETYEQEFARLNVPAFHYGIVHNALEALDREVPQAQAKSKELYDQVTALRDQLCREYEAAGPHYQRQYHEKHELHLNWATPEYLALQARYKAASDYLSRLYKSTNRTPMPTRVRLYRLALAADRAEEQKVRAIDDHKAANPHYGLRYTPSQEVKALANERDIKSREFFDAMRESMLPVPTPA